MEYGVCVLCVSYNNIQNLNTFHFGVRCEVNPRYINKILKSNLQISINLVKKTYNFINMIIN